MQQHFYNDHTDTAVVYFVISFTGAAKYQGSIYYFFVEIVSAAASFSIAYMLIALMLYWNEADQIVSMIANIAPLLCGVLILLKELPLLLRGFRYFFRFHGHWT